MSQPALTIGAMRSRARSFTEECLKTLAHVMMHPKASHMARITAANSLLDRGWGKAQQIISGDELAPIVVNHIVRKIVGDDTQAKVIDHVANPLPALENPAQTVNGALSVNALGESLEGRSKADIEAETIAKLRKKEP